MGHLKIQINNSIVLQNNKLPLRDKTCYDDVIVDDRLAEENDLTKKKKKPKLKSKTKIISMNTWRRKHKL